MLDKRTYQILSRMAHVCCDGSYKIIDRTELSTDDSVLASSLQYLKDNEMIDVKYADEKVCCVNVMPKGRLALGDRVNVRRRVLGGAVYLYIIGGCFVAGFVGAFLGAWLGGLL